MNLMSLPILSDIDNLLVNVPGAARSCRPDALHRPVIAYVVRDIAPCGGVETRLAAYADALARHGYRVIFIAERNDNTAIAARYEWIRLNFHASNFLKALGRTLEICKADIVEFQIKNRRSIRRFNRMDFGACRTGCVVHCELNGIDTAPLMHLDYRIIISDRLLSIDYSTIGPHVILPNAIAEVKKAWRYCGQRKALIISRLRKNKYLQLCAAVEFCQARDIPFEIAGTPPGAPTVRRLKRRYSLPPDIFSPGAINTREYLDKNAGTYLFVAGVGQVLLEAGAAGYPCLLASDKGAAYSTFLTRRNVTRNYGRNLTLAYPDERHASVRVAEIDISNIGDYDISDIIREEFSFSRRFSQYLACIAPDTTPAP